VFCSFRKLYNKGGSGQRFHHRQGHAGGEHRRHLAGKANGKVRTAYIASEVWEVQCKNMTIGNKFLERWRYGGVVQKKKKKKKKKKPVYIKKKKKKF
jgi:hypothetical protein